MSWGHARSRNLVRWEWLPLALVPDELGDIWSGSAAVLDDERLVAAFTHHSENRQAQSLAFSDDGGIVWQKFAGNPVLISERRDFRDPKIFHFEDSWRMIVAAGRDAQIFSSPDLISWTRESDFPTPNAGWIWECPDLFELNGKWILLGSFIVPNAPSQTHYWIGEFDGRTFSPASGPHRLSFGPDDYAAASWNGAPENRRVIIGWMNSWSYAAKTPTESDGFRGAMTLPRELSLRNGQLRQHPARELEAYRGEAIPFDGQTVSLDARAFEIEVELEVKLNGRAFLSLLKGATSVAAIGYDEEFSDEDEWQAVSLSRDFPLEGPKEFQFFVGIEPKPRRVFFRVFVDSCSVEVFAQNGEIYGAALVFPPDGAWNIEWFAARATVVSGTIWPLELN